MNPATKIRPFSWLFIGLVFCASLTSFSPAFAAPVKNATYEEFQELVKDSVAKVPDLQMLWYWQRSDNQPVYFGGGALRGLLKWLAKNLETHSLEEVRAMKVPPVKNLLIQTDADRDLFSDSFDRAWFKQNFVPYGNWDILEKSFYESSKQAGGPSIEKVRVNPTRLEDPSGGLEAFYRGELRYLDVPEDLFAPFRGEKTALKGNKKSALVLRALRFAHELDLKIPDITLASMRAAVAAEAKDLGAENYWVQKALTKLSKAYGDETKSLLKALDSVGLTKPLAANAYRIHKLNKDQYFYFELPAENVAKEDFWRFLRHAKPEAASYATQKRLEKITTFDDVLRAVFPDEGPELLTSVVSEPLIVDIFPHFAKLNPAPTPENILTLKKLVKGEKARLAIKRVECEQAKSAADFLAAVHFDPQKSSADSTQKTMALIEENMEKFLSFTPTLAEVDRLREMSTGPYVGYETVERIWSKLLKYLPAQANTELAAAEKAEDVLKLLPAWRSAHVNRKELPPSPSLHAFLETAVPKFLALNPSPQEVQEMQEITVKFTSFHAPLWGGRLRATHSPSEFARALGEISFRGPGRATLVDLLILRHAEHLRNLPYDGFAYEKIYMMAQSPTTMKVLLDLELSKLPMPRAFTEIAFAKHLPFLSKEEKAALVLKNQAQFFRVRPKSAQIAELEKALDIKLTPPPSPPTPISKIGAFCGRWFTFGKK